MSERVTIGVLGCANIAERFLIPSLLEMKGLYEVAGVASRTLEKAEAFGGKFGVRAVEGYDAMLNDPSLDAVYIPLPNACHAEFIGQALGNGLHVLVEKSLACTYAEVVRLNQAAESKGLVLMENFQFRFHRQLAEIRRILANGEIGELRCLRSAFGFPPFPDAENIRYSKALGGGALLDAGAYTLKVSQIFLGADLEVAAANLNTPEGYEVDIWGGAYLRQKNGAHFSEVAFGFDQQYQCSLEIWGSKGRLTTNRLFTSPPGYTATINIEQGGDQRVVEVAPDNHFLNMLTHFHGLVTGKTDPAAEYAQNTNQSRLLEETVKVAKAARG